MTMTFIHNQCQESRYIRLYSAGLDILSLGCHAGVHIYFCLMFDCVNVNVFGWTVWCVGGVGAGHQ